MIGYSSLNGHFVILIVPFVMDYRDVYGTLEKCSIVY